MKELKPLEEITENVKGVYEKRTPEVLTAIGIKKYADRVETKEYCGNSSYPSRELNDKEIKSISNCIYDEFNKHFHLKELGLSEEAYSRLSQLKTRSGKKSIDMLTKAYLDIGREGFESEVRTIIKEKAKEGKDIGFEDLAKIITEGAKNYIDKANTYELVLLKDQKYVPEMIDFINEVVETGELKITKEETKKNGEVKISEKTIRVSDQIREKIKITDQDKFWFQLLPKYSLLIGSAFGKNAKKLMQGNGEEITWH